MIYYYNTLAHSINTFVNLCFNGDNERDGNRRRKSTPAMQQQQVSVSVFTVQAAGEAC